MDYSNRQHGILWIVQTILACCIVICLLNPIFKDIYILAFLVVLWFVVTWIKYTDVMFKLFSNVNVLKPLAFFLVLFLYWLVGHADMPLSYIVFYICMLIALFYIEVRDNKDLLFITLVSLAYITIISVSTLSVYSIKPGISRVLAYGDPELVKMYGGEMYVTPFIAGYDGIYLIVFILPALNYARKKATSWRRLIIITLFILYSVVLLLSQYFIAIILWIITLVILVTNSRSLRNKVLIGFLILFGLVFFVAVGPIILNKLADSGMFSYNITIRLREIANALLGNTSSGSDIKVRSSLYLMSINTFFDHPIFGVGNIGTLYVGYGNHSTILDTFAKYGLLGGIPFLLYYYCPIKEIFRRLNASQRQAFKISIIMFLILGLINRADTNANYAIIYIVLPAILYSVDNLPYKRENLKYISQ